jgi:chitin synthase
MGGVDAAFAPGQILFMVFEYIYIALLVMCFVLYRPIPSISNFRSMGNRPQGSKFAYTAAAVFFALLMGYMLFCSVWLTIKGIEATIATLNADNEHFGQNFNDTVKAIFGNRIFRDLIVSTASTYGLYLLSSLFFFDFLHMFTSFIQYLLLSPSYVNILYLPSSFTSNGSNVYAFCNTHDVSWGTKGDNTMKTDLGVVKVGTDNKVEVDVPSKDEDIDHEYDRVLKILAKPRTEEKQKRDEQTKQEDYYKSFRTRVVLIWLISNLALIEGILHSNAGLGISVQGSASTANIYLEVSMNPSFRGS